LQPPVFASGIFGEGIEDSMRTAANLPAWPGMDQRDSRTMLVEACASHDQLVTQAPN
jgi:hypothetical protein